MKGALFALALVACGSSAVDDIVPPDIDATVRTPPPDASNPFGDGGPVAWDAGYDATKFNGGGPFLCGTCVCDGTLDMCVWCGGGGAPLLSDAGFGDASACDTDSGQSNCRQIPIECFPNPTCACIAQFAGAGTCAVDPSGNGYSFTCPPKP